MVSTVVCAGVIHLVVATGVFPAGAVAPRGSTAQEPAILGEWVLNREQSDDPREILRARQEGMERRRPPMGGPGGMGGRGGMGGPGPRHGGGADAGPMRQISELVLVAPEGFTITQQHGDLVFACEGGRRAVVTPDGKKVHDALDDLEIKAKWKGDHLVVERKFYFGASLVEEYSVSSETRQLVVLMEFHPGRGDAVRFRRVFDRPVEPAAP